MIINEHILKLSGTAFLEQGLPRGRTIKVGSRHSAIVDVADFDRLNRHSWYLAGAGYAAARIGGKNVKMHHMVITRKMGCQIDHINCNKLDNRRLNLRVATRGQNNMNRLSHRGTSSRFKGVSWNKEKQRWEAFITKDGRCYRMGYFLKERHAAMARDMWARDLHGEFTRLNFPNAYGVN